VPFSLLSPERLFQTAQFVLNSLQELAKEGHPTPRGISRAYALHMLAEQGRELGAYKAARHAYNALLSLRVPRAWRDGIEMNHLVIRTKPFSDREELAPMCYRCSSPNPLLNEDGDICTTCKHRFVRNFGSFDVLPLVQFYLAPGVTHEQAVKAFAETDSIVSTNNKLARAKQEDDGHADRMMIGGDSDEEEAGGFGGDDDDLFQSMLAEEPGLDGRFAPLQCNVAVLRQMKKHTVFVRRWGDRYEYFKNVIGEMPVIMCEKCQHFFSEEDFESHALVHSNCPFCRALQPDFIEEKPEDLDNSRSMY
jgi:intraflagellar transport protein 122